ncbi:MAG: DNA translocase FtsK, partial [Acutalibacteraceae bacterium]
MAEKQKKKTTANKNNSPKTKNNARKNNGKPVEKENKKGINHQAKAILLFALGLIVVCMIFIKGASVWNALRNVLFGIMGTSSLVFAGVIFYVAISTACGKSVGKSKAKVIFCISLIVLSCMEFYIFSSSLPKEGNYFTVLGQIFTHGYSADGLFARGAGIIGGILGYPLVFACGNMVAGIITTIVLAAMILLVTGISLMDIGNGVKKTASGVKNGAGHIKEKRVERKRYREEMEAHNDAQIDIALDKKTLRKRKKSKNDEDISRKNNDYNISDYTEKDENASAVSGQELIDIMNDVNGLGKDLTASDIAKKITKKKKTPHYEKGAKQADPETVEVTEILDKIEFKEEVKKVTNEIDLAKKTFKEAYDYPPIQLLSPPKPSMGNAREELTENADKLVSTLESFGVHVTITDISRGPSVTRYELQPAPGVKISKITNLSDDIALNLAANGVRIEAPIPGKAAVGIEVPNKIISMVTMRELIDSDEFVNSESKLTCVLGRDISGKIVTTDLSKMPHLLIAGTTGAGKSVCVNSLLMSVLYKASPDEVKFLLIDPKMVEFSKYKGIPHLLVPVVSDAKKAAGALGWAVTEMLNRYKMFSEYECKDIDSYNQLIESNLQYVKDNPPEEGEEQDVLSINGLDVHTEKMPRIVIAIDELADLMMAAPNEVEESICRLAQMARAAGMHLVIATQRPSVNVITGVIKANIPSRIALRVSSNIDSRTILDYGGAEKLIGRGDMLFSPVGAPKPVRVQGCFASDSEIERV